jgi:acetyltransferase-like isoleucine patch superfamily enzyme
MSQFIYEIKGKIKNIVDFNFAKKNNKTCRLSSGSRYCGALFGGWNVVSKKCDVSFASIGVGSYIGTRSYLPGAFIGNFCSLGCDVVLVSGKHPTRVFVSTNPIFYDTETKFPLGNCAQHFQERGSTPDGHSIHIGNDVWIGRGVMIKEGVTIGDGAIIGMGSVIVQDVMPYQIVGGNPGKLIRLRFSSDQIRKLLEIQWWNWPISVIQSRKNDFSNVEVFINKYYQ